MVSAERLEKDMPYKTIQDLCSAGGCALMFLSLKAQAELGSPDSQSCCCLAVY